MLCFSIKIIKNFDSTKSFVLINLTGIEFQIFKGNNYLKNPEHFRCVYCLFVFLYLCLLPHSDVGFFSPMYMNSSCNIYVTYLIQVFSLVYLILLLFGVTLS